MTGHVTSAMQGAQHGKPPQHTKDTIKFATRRLGVQVTANGNGRQAVILPGPTGELVAHGIMRDRATQFLAGAHEPVAHLPVFRRQGQAADATLGGATKPGRFHKVGPQVLSVNENIVTMAYRRILRHSDLPYSIPNDISVELTDL